MGRDSVSYDHFVLLPVHRCMVFGLLCCCVAVCRMYPVMQDARCKHAKTENMQSSEPLRPSGKNRRKNWFVRRTGTFFHPLECWNGSSQVDASFLSVSLQRSVRSLHTNARTRLVVQQKNRTSMSRIPKGSTCAGSVEYSCGPETRNVNFVTVAVLKAGTQVEMCSELVRDEQQQPVRERS